MPKGEDSRLPAARATGSGVSWAWIVAGSAVMAGVVLFVGVALVVAVAVLGKANRPGSDSGDRTGVTDSKPPAPAPVADPSAPDPAAPVVVSGDARADVDEL